MGVFERGDTTDISNVAGGLWAKSQPTKGASAIIDGNFGAAARLGIRSHSALAIFV